VGYPSFEPGEEKNRYRSKVGGSLEVEGPEMAWEMGCESSLFVSSGLIFHPPISLKLFYPSQSPVLT
jgi:hypothetical protein